MSRIGPTLLALALAGLLTLAAYTDAALVAAAVLLVQVLVATAPAPVDAAGRAVLVPKLAATLAGSVVATAVTLHPDLLHGADGTSPDVVGATDTGTFAAVLPAVAVGVVVALVAQMLRRDGRSGLVESTAYAVTSCVFAVLAVGWVGAVQSPGDAQVVAVGAAGVAAGLLVWLLPIDRWTCGSLAVLAGGAAGAVVSLQVDWIMTWLFGVAVGCATALFAVLGQVVARAWSRGHTHAAAGWGFPGALAIALAAPVVYIGGQLVGVPGV